MQQESSVIPARLFWSPGACMWAKPAALFHGVDHDGIRCLSSSTASDCDGESRCRHFSTSSMELLMTSAFTVYVGMSSCRLVYAVASSEGSMLLKVGLNINVVC